jgi:putative DNA methylase
VRPQFRLYGKLVLRKDGEKEYLPASPADLEAYASCSRKLQAEIQQGNSVIPTLTLQDGYNTKQAMRYGFLSWRDFFNDRQLLALSLLRSSIVKLADRPTRDALLTLFSGVLEFNNVFASYKGEGTGAVRHMFAHHILKPERAPIEANVWGTPKSSGSFSNLLRSRLLRAIDYRESPTEVNGTGSASGRVSSPSFAGELCEWGEPMPPRGIAISCGDSSATALSARSVDLIVTDLYVVKPFWTSGCPW